MADNIDQLLDDCKIILFKSTNLILEELGGVARSPLQESAVDLLLVQLEGGQLLVIHIDLIV